MDDLSKAIADILGSEEGMEQVKQMASMLGIDAKTVENLTGNTTPQPEPSPKTHAKDHSAGTIPNGLDLDTILMIQRVMSAMQGEDKNTRLLDALKPHLSQEKSQKIDQAKQMMQMMELLPMLFGNNGSGPSLFQKGE